MQELQDSLSIFVGLALVTHLYHSESRLLSILAGIRGPDLLQLLPGGHGEFLEGNILNELAKDLCAPGTQLGPDLCQNILGRVVGPAFHLNDTQTPVYFSEMPAGTSVESLEHYAQGIRKDTFNMMDKCYALNPGNNCRQNDQFYGQPEPPAYDLFNIAVPMVRAPHIAFTNRLHCAAYTCI